MKRMLSMLIVLVLLVCTVQYLKEDKVNASDESDYSAKLTKKLKDKIDGSEGDEIIDVYLFLNDVDEEDAMSIFASKYPEEYSIYVREKESDYEFPAYYADLSLKNPNGFDTPIKSKEETELIQRAIQSKRIVYKNMYKEKNNVFLSKYSQYFEKVTFVSDYSPMIIVSMSKDRIMNILDCSDILWMDLFVEFQIEDELALANQITRANYVRDNCGNKGAGVKIGQIESYIPDTTDSQLSGQAITTVSGSVNSGGHATRVARIIVGKTNGIVPSAQLFSIGCNKTSFYSAVESLLDLHVNIITMSAGYAEGGLYDTMSKWVDHIAITHDVHFVKSAGNQSTFNSSTGDVSDGIITSPGMAYNAITVGGYNDMNTLSQADDIMYSGSSFVVNGSNRPEKPNLLAPAENIYFEGYGNYSGTSYAAPQVASFIAQLCSYNAGFMLKQSEVNAMLMASSAIKVKVHTNGSGVQGESFLYAFRVNNNPQISNKEGAGKADARWLRGIAVNWHCWSHTINQSDFPYEKYVTINASSNSLTRVAIFWLKRNSISGSNHVGVTPTQISMSNLDLYVYGPDGNQISSSSTQQANFEIVQFVPTVTGQYRIKITRASGSSDKEIVGIAVW